MNSFIPFKQVDVFTAIPYLGNPVAVIFEGDRFSTTQMQKIANWTHLSETTFVCKAQDSKADYRLRIFSTQNELPFAGHPTIGSAFAVLENGLKPKNHDYLVQECQKGLVELPLDQQQIFLTMPQPHLTMINYDLIRQLCDALKVKVTDIKAQALVNVGIVWLTLQLKNAAQVLNLQPNFQQIAKLTPNGVSGVTVFGFYEDLSIADIEVRSFAPREGANEDPVCGSGNGAVAILIQENHLLTKTTYTAQQGIKLGRVGRIKVKFLSNGRVLVGGNAITCIEGKLRIPDSF